MRLRILTSTLAVFALAAATSAQTLPAHAGPANNGGSAGWAMFFDLDSASGVTVTHLTTASAAVAGGAYSVEILTRAGTALGGPVGSGPGSSAAGWNSLGTAPATQGPVSSQVSLLIDIPDIVVPAGQKVGVAMRFNTSGPRYFGTGTPAYSVFSDANLTLTTGDSRSAPFTTGGSFFTSRALVGQVDYMGGGGPTKFCTAKTTLACGVPSIAASGVSSVTATSGFKITAGPARDNRSGILLYNNAANSVPGLPFEGGTLCVSAMGLRRAGSTNSMGSCPPTPIGCAGVFAIDMNTFAQGMWVVPDCAGAPTATLPNNPAAFLLNMGDTINAQFWGRDSVATGSFLSDGVSYVQGP
jgi:hypothetical protein